jgi:formylglycine-generating enzyme required for sulfatase activity
MCGGAAVTRGQSPQITAFDAPGSLSFAQPAGYTNFGLQWAPSARGPWTNCAALAAQEAVSSTGRVAIPAFFRVVATVVTNPAASLPFENMAYVPAGTNSGVDLADAPNASAYVGAYRYTLVLKQPMYVDRFEVTNDEVVRVLNWAYRQGLITIASGQYVNSTQGGTSRLLVDLVNGGASRIVWDSANSIFCMKQVKGSGFPAIEITWYGAVAYCNWRSLMAGLTPCYDLAAIFPVFDYTNYNANVTGYRLPTEEEWEYLARGGLRSRRFPWGDFITRTNANFAALWGTNNQPIPFPTTQPAIPMYEYDLMERPYYHPDFDGDFMNAALSPVGSFAANGYGLYDVAGNAREYCWERDYGVRPVVRGGSFGAESRYLRNRHHGHWPFPPDTTGPDYGLRTMRRAAP